MINGISVAVDIGDHTCCVKQVTEEPSQEPALTCCFSDCDGVSKAPWHFLSPPMPSPSSKVLRYHFVESQFLFILYFCLTHTQNLYPKDWLGFFSCFLGDAQKQCNDSTLSARPLEEAQRWNKWDSTQTVDDTQDQIYFWFKVYRK